MLERTDSSKKFRSHEASERHMVLLFRSVCKPPRERKCTISLHGTSLQFLLTSAMFPSSAFAAMVAFSNPLEGFLAGFSRSCRESKLWITFCMGGFVVGRGVGQGQREVDAERTKAEAGAIGRDRESSGTAEAAKRLTG